MPDRRAGNGIPWFAVTILLTGLAAAVAVLAFPPTGRPSLPGLYPQPFDEVGADLREAIVEALGAGAWVFLLGWLSIGFSRLRGRPWLPWLGRVLGWALLTASTCVMADWIGPDRLPGPLPGSGGSVGAFAALWLDAHLQRAGTLVLVAAALLGLFLAADRVVLCLLRSLR